jgi:hypothetical protein
MGDINDMYNVRCVVPGNGTRKRPRYDLDDNIYFKNAYIRPNFTYPRFNLNIASGANQSVLAFGAVGDGVTDDTAAFNAALASGCLVTVPGGTFLIAGQLTAPSGAGIIGECRLNTILRFTSNVAGALITAQGENMFSTFRITYGGTNFTTNTVFSITGSTTLIENMLMQSSDSSPAYGISFDGVALSTRIQSSTIHGTLIGIRFTAAAARGMISGNLVNAGTNGVSVDTTNAGVNNVFTSNYWRNNGGAYAPVNAVVAATFIGNQGLVNTYAGAGLAASTIFDQGTTTFANVTQAYAVDGLKVVGNRSATYTVTDGASTLSRTLPTGDMTAAELTNVLKQLVIDLGLGTTNTEAGGHGLLDTAYTP